MRWRGRVAVQGQGQPSWHVAVKTRACAYLAAWCTSQGSRQHRWEHVRAAGLGWRCWPGKAAGHRAQAGVGACACASRSVRPAARSRGARHGYLAQVWLLAVHTHARTKGACIHSATHDVATGPWEPAANFKVETEPQTSPLAPPLPVMHIQSARLHIDKSKGAYACLTVVAAEGHQLLQLAVDGRAPACRSQYNHGSMQCK